MSKTKTDRKVNRCIKQLNKQLRDDVFGDRFFARQYRKAYVDGLSYYQYELIDRECPERNRVIRHWLWSGEIIHSYKVHIEMNDFIVTSDFWKKYWKKHPRRKYKYVGMM